MVQRIASIELLERIAWLGPGSTARDPMETVSSVLDIGCGTGLLAVHMAKRLPRGKVLGLDLSPAMVSKAKEFARTESVDNLRILELDAESMEFSEEFDLVVSNAAFHWMRNAGNLLERVFRSMRRGGILAVQFPLLIEAHPMVATMLRAIESTGLQAHYENWDFPWFRTTPSAYRQLLESKGFEVSVVEQTEDEFFLSQEAFLTFFNAVGLPLYFAGLKEADAERLRRACEEEAALLVAACGNVVRFIRLFAQARKP